MNMKIPVFWMIMEIVTPRAYHITKPAKKKMVRVHQLKEKMELEIVRLLNMLQSIISKSVYLLVIPIRMNTLSN